MVRDHHLKRARPALRFCDVRDRAPPSCASLLFLRSSLAEAHGFRACADTIPDSQSQSQSHRTSPSALLLVLSLALKLSSFLCIVPLFLLRRTLKASKASQESKVATPHTRSTYASTSRGPVSISTRNNKNNTNKHFKYTMDPPHAASNDGDATTQPTTTTKGSDTQGVCRFPTSTEHVSPISVLPLIQPSPNNP
jgi:hypothetical protein